MSSGGGIQHCALEQKAKRSGVDCRARLTAGARFSAVMDVPDLDEIVVVLEMELGRVDVNGLNGADDALLIYAVVARAVGDASASGTVDEVAMNAAVDDLEQLPRGRRREWRRRCGSGEKSRVQV